MYRNLPEINAKLAVESLVYFIKKEVERIGFKKVVLGLSGGIDSALVAYLAVEALGAKNVTGLLLPYKLSSKNSIIDAMKVVEATNMNHIKLEITTAVDNFSENCMVGEKNKKARLGNIMARMRMIAIFDYSFANKALVLGTSNKSEIALGYSTLFGDIASAVNPIGDLYKTDVFKLSKYLNLPHSIITKPPSADLWEGQTDEKEIGFSYEEIDPILYNILDKRREKEELLNMGFDKKLVEMISEKIISTHFKRKIPIIAKISKRTFGVDFLYAKDFNS